jgi:hypothetical protein
MKNILYILLLLSTISFAQFKSDLDKPVDIKGGIVNNSPSSFLLGFINPQNFQMNHSVSMSYSSFGGEGMALGVYTNNMSYKFSENLNIEADVSFVNSPYSSLGEGHSKQINGIYLSRAQLNYKIADNFKVMVRYNQVPNSFYSPYGYYRPNPFFSGENNWFD